MKISQDQIQSLYQFTSDHYVEYYDLQTELVDHLANAIEQQWQENNKVSFSDALHIEFKKFGIFGFMDVVEKRQISLTKKYNNLVINNLKNFFTIPKTVLILMVVGIIFYLLEMFQHNIPLIQILFSILTIIFIIGIAILSKRNKKITLKTKKKWLLKEIIFGYGSISGLINIPIQLAIYNKSDNYHNWVLFLFSFLIIILVLVEYIVLILIPSKAEIYLKETYPEYDITK